MKLKPLRQMFLILLSPTCAKISAQNDANLFGHNAPADWDRELFKPRNDAEKHAVSIF